MYPCDQVANHYWNVVLEQSTMMAVTAVTLEWEYLCSFILNTRLAWCPNEEERDHNADDSQYSDWIEHRDITSDKIS
jgi:hypothetical protein